MLPRLPTPHAFFNSKTAGRIFTKLGMDVMPLSTSAYLTCILQSTTSPWPVTSRLLQLDGAVYIDWSNNVCCCGVRSIVLLVRCAHCADKRTHVISFGNTEQSMRRTCHTTLPLLRIPSLLLQSPVVTRVCVPPILAFRNPEFCISGFCMIIRMNSGYFLKQR